MRNISLNLLLIFCLIFVGCSRPINGSKTDLSSPEKSLYAAFYAMQNGLYEEYLNCLAEMARLPYGVTQEEQLERLKKRFSNSRKLNNKDFNLKNLSIIIRKVIYSRDKNAAILIYDSTYKGEYLENSEAALIFLEGGRWKLGLMEYLSDWETLDNFQKSDSSAYLSKIQKWFREY